MAWDVIGEYLSKPIRFLHLKSSEEYSADRSVKESVLVLYFNENSKSIEVLLEQIINDLPLVIIVAGVNSMSSFDLLLDILSRKKTQDHIMTNVCESDNLEEIIEDLVNGNWPAEERHNDWKCYSILSIGNKSKVNEFTEAVKSLGYLTNK